MNRDEFILELEKLNIDVTEEELDKLNIYYNLLIDYNKVMNLTGITVEKEVYLKHFYDSLTIVKAINLNKVNTICDIGTGAGFPGLVIAIFFPDIKVTLVDSLRKRIDFLNIVINKININNVETIHDRIEEFSIKHINEYDVVTSRAVAKLNILLELSINMVKLDGYFIALKGNVKEEIENSKNAINLLDCKLEEIIDFYLPIENSYRSIVKIKKIKNTNSKYPRKFDKIKKNPL